MKRRLALSLSLCILLTSCAVSGASPGDVSKGAANRASDAERPAYGEPPQSDAGRFYAGTSVSFERGVYTAFGDGVYYMEGDALTQIVADEIPYDVSICTDGLTLFYVNLAGELTEVNLTDGSTRLVTDAPIYPFGSSVVGAGRDVAYVEMPAGYEEESGLEARPESVAAVSRETGEVVESWDGFRGLACGDGYTAITAVSYDVSPRRMLAFDADGNVVVDEPYAWSASADGGAFYYSAAPGPDGGSACTLRRVFSGADEEILSFNVSDGECFGFSVGGFLATVHYYDANGDFAQVRYDLRTGERIPQARLSPAEGDVDYWSGGYVWNGADYLTSASRICRMTDGRPVDVFDAPSDIWPTSLTLCDGWIFADCMEGEFYVFPLDESGAHPIPIISQVHSLEERDEKSGATVTGYYPYLSTGGIYHWERLNDALTLYNEEARERAEQDALECLRQASELVENGFTEADAPFSSTVRAYIQRADAAALCFTEHRTIDNRVNRQALDIKTGYNFDAADGHALSLEEVATDLEGLKEALAAAVKDSDSVSAEQMREFLDAALSAESLVSSPAFSWTLGYEGVSFYFNADVNFPYARQSVKYYLPFSAYPDLFNPDYFAVPESYAYDILLDYYFTEAYQMEYYGGQENVLPYLMAPNAFGANINGADVAVPLDADFACATVVHLCDKTPQAALPHTGGSNFLLLQRYGDDGETMSLDIFTIDDQLREFYDFGEGVLPQYLPPDANGAACQWLGNPEQFAVLRYDAAGDGYVQRILYGFNYGVPQVLDLSGASLAVG